MRSWTEPNKKLLLPIAGDQPTGEDPRYSDEFSELKAEIEKKSDVQFERIIELSETILTERAKDLRVACYWIMAQSRLAGLNGLLAGMNLLVGLVNDFGDKLHPEKPRARKAALQWFQQDKILTFAQGATSNPDTDEVMASLEIYDALFASLSDLCAEPMSWPDLKAWLQKLKDTQPKEPTAESKPASDEAQTKPVSTRPTSPAPMATAPVTSSIESKNQYLQTLKGLLAYYREQGEWGRCVSVALASQWGELTLPPNDQGKTRLPPPREPSLAKVRHAQDNQQHQEALLAALDVFMEPSGLYHLDLVKVMADSAQALQQPQLRVTIEAQVTALVNNWPKLLQLKFDNDEPFVGSAAAAWIEQLGQSNGNSSDSDATDVLPQWLAEARKVANEKDIQQALLCLDEKPTGNRLHQAYIDFCKAQLCIDQQHADSAYPLLLKLDATVSEYHLAETAPSFAMQVWRQLHRLISDRLSSLESEAAKQDAEAHLLRLQSSMCTTDVARALQWL